MKNAIPIVKESYTRCIPKDVIGRFYDIFLKSNQSIAPMFAKTDFTVQKDLLRHGIHLAIMFANGEYLGKSGIERIRKSHSKAGMNVNPNLYRYWKASFLQAISETDSEFSEQIRKAWDSVLQQTIDYIIEGYDAS